MLHASLFLQTKTNSEKITLDVFSTVNGSCSDSLLDSHRTLDRGHPHFAMWCKTLQCSAVGNTDQLQQVNGLNYKNTICSRNSSVSTLFYFCNRSDVYVVFYLGLTP